MPYRLVRSDRILKKHPGQFTIGLYPAKKPVPPLGLSIKQNDKDTFVYLPSPDFDRASQMKVDADHVLDVHGDFSAEDYTSTGGFRTSSIQAAWRKAFELASAKWHDSLGD